MTVRLVATGGTISSHHDGQGWTELTGADLVAELRDDLDRAGVEVEVVEVAAGPSSHLSVDDMVAIAGHVRAALSEGQGVVVTHGTDTIELTSFVTDLLLPAADDRPPVVFTGSMRVHSHPQPDGPRNLLDALVVAGDTAARGRGVLVCVDGMLHAAARVVKCDAGSLDAFSSAPLGPVGAVHGGTVAVHHDAPPAGPHATELAADVPLLTVYPSIDPNEVARTLDGRRGAVLEVFGDLNVPRSLWGPIHEAWRAGTLVVLASRPFTATTRSEGLDLLGAIGAGGLTAQKARLATMAALGGDATRDDAIAFLHARRLVRPHDQRSST
jgi:L-asparaginase